MLKNFLNSKLGADLRIKELRTEQVEINVHGEKPPGTKLRIKMIENHYPFGGKFNQELQKSSPDEWKYYFNYGYCVSEMKWQHTEKVKGVNDFTRGDKIRDWFDEQDILRVPILTKITITPVDQVDRKQFLICMRRQLVEADLNGFIK